MSINAALLIILLLIAVFFLFVEIFTVLFMLTGLPERKARFQVISILTNTGFATGESEVITSSRRRRRLATITMLFSATSNPLLVLDYYGDSAIVEIRITDLPDVLAGKTLAEGPLKTEYGLLVFVIKRAGEIRHDVGRTMCCRRATASCCSDR